MANSTIKVTAEMADYATKMSKSAHDLDHMLDELKIKLDAAAQEWDGDSRQNYDIAMAEWTEAVQTLNGILNRMGQAVGRAYDKYMTVEGDISKRWGAHQR